MTATISKKFPLMDIWSSLLNVISLQLPTFLFSAFFSTAVVGYYALSMNVLQLHMSLIGAAISQVFFQRAAEAKFDGTLARIAEETFLRLSLIGVFPILLLAATGKDLFIVVFGPAWGEAGVFVQILAHLPMNNRAILPAPFPSFPSVHAAHLYSMD